MVVTVAEVHECTQYHWTVYLLELNGENGQLYVTYNLPQLKHFFKTQEVLLSVFHAYRHLGYSGEVGPRSPPPSRLINWESSCSFQDTCQVMYMKNTDSGYQKDASKLVPGFMGGLSFVPLRSFWFPPLNLLFSQKLASFDQCQSQRAASKSMQWRQSEEGVQNEEITKLKRAEASPEKSSIPKQSQPPFEKLLCTASEALKVERRWAQLPGVQPGREGMIKEPGYPHGF